MVLELRGAMHAGREGGGKFCRTAPLQRFYSFAHHTCSFLGFFPPPSLFMSVTDACAACSCCRGGRACCPSPEAPPA
jgi:hypothetical protein